MFLQITRVRRVLCFIRVGTVGTVGTVSVLCSNIGGAGGSDTRLSRSHPPTGPAPGVAVSLSHAFPLVMDRLRR